MTKLTSLQMVTIFYCIGLMFIIYTLFTETHIIYSLGPIKSWIYGIPITMSSLGYHLLFFGIIMFIVGTSFLLWSDGKKILIYSSFTIQIMFVILLVVVWILLSIRNNLGSILRFENENGLVIFGLLFFSTIMSTCMCLFHLKFGFINFYKKIKTNYYSLFLQIGRLWKKEEKLFIYILLGLVFFLIVITHVKNIFFNGIPPTYDDVAHIHNTALVAKYFYPGWDAGWYCGRPPLLFYPPLSYWFAAIPFWLIGVNIFTSYAIMSLFFYSILPIAIFFLARECGISRFYSLLGTILFSMSYSLNRAYILYGQYPTLVSLFFLLITLVMFVRFSNTNKSSRIYSWTGMTFFTTATLLSHHQTGYFLISMIFMTTIILSILERKISIFILSLASILLSIGLCGFWLIPLFNFLNLGIQASMLGTDLNFQAWAFHPLQDIYGLVIGGLGVHFFLLSLLSVIMSIFLCLKTKYWNLRLSVAIWLWMIVTLFLILNIWPSIYNFGILFILFQFVVFYALMRSGFIIQQENELLLKSVFVLIPFFISGLVLGIGPPNVLKDFVPFYNIFSLERFLFYSLSVGCIFTVVALKILIDSTLNIKVKESWRILTSILLVTIILISIANTYKIEPSATRLYEMRRSSKLSVPDDMISYFKQQISSGNYGRILSINTPYWIYVFPELVGIPLVDGWYPTSRLARILNKFPSSQINYPDGPGINDTEVWEYHIQKSEDLGIMWIVTSTNTKNIDLINEKFNLELNTDTYNIWKSKANVSMLKAPEGIQFDYIRNSEELIELKIKTEELRKIDVVIKETYFPYWQAYLASEELSIQENNDGFITLENLLLQPGKHEITLVFLEPFNYGIIISLASAILILGILIYTILQKKNDN